MSVVFFLCPFQCFLFVVFFIFALLTGIRRKLNSALMCVSQMTGADRHFSEMFLSNFLLFLSFKMYFMYNLLKGIFRLCFWFFLRSLYILDINPVSYKAGKDSLPLHGLPLHYIFVCLFLQLFSFFPKSYLKIFHLNSHLTCFSILSLY